ncbi:Hypp6051 [Branchiostoma lanceolatum]|uniref:Hypp6051 protein n=1 Tax=Branchiostoma lanceolatum TaxID=7740 RepID=A0A8J9WHK9_BRALA|nr:Hypp6051 [Branchiostoma lanceolatum]
MAAKDNLHVYEMEIGLELGYKNLNTVTSRGARLDKRLKQANKLMASLLQDAERSKPVIEFFQDFGARLDVSHDSSGNCVLHFADRDDLVGFQCTYRKGLPKQLSKIMITPEISAAVNGEELVVIIMVKEEDFAKGMNFLDSDHTNDWFTSDSSSNTEETPRTPGKQGSSGDNEKDETGRGMSKSLSAQDSLDSTSKSDHAYTADDSSSHQLTATSLDDSSDSEDATDGGDGNETVQQRLQCDSCQRITRPSRPLRCIVGHFICKKCFMKYFKKTNENDRCPALACRQPLSATFRTSDHSATEDVWIYVDDSNIWVEGKKVVGRARNFPRVVEDPRVRIDTGKLADLIAEERNVVMGTLYGSEPPKIDSVWRKIRERGWRVPQPKRKSYITGREKEVDSQLVADVTCLACETPEEKRGIISLVTGDADMMPVLQKILEKPPWIAEIWMWEHAISKKIKDLPRIYPDRVRVEFLDQYVQRLTYTNYIFTIKEMPRIKKLLITQAVVLTEVERMSRHKNEEWVKQVEQLCGWPFQYNWLCENEDFTEDLLLVFLRAKNQSGQVSYPDLAYVMGVLLSKPDLTRNAADILTYQAYRGRVPQGNQILLSNRFSTLDGMCDSLDTFTDDEDDDEDQPDVFEIQESNYQSTEGAGAVGGEEQPWNLQMTTKNLPQAKYSQRCSRKFNCKHGKTCHYTHTADEMEFFKQRPVGAQYYKTRGCNRWPNCRKRDYDCDYAHGPKDACCLKCNSRGHFTDDCPM